MKDDRPAPLLTLTDPLHPGPLHDVITDDRSAHPHEPWSPKPWRVGAAAAAVLLAAIALTPHTKTAQRRERILSASSITLRDASAGDLGRTDRPEGFTLTNPSHEVIHLQSVALDDYPKVTVAQTVAPGETVQVTVPLPAECPTTLPERPSTMTVTYWVQDVTKTTRLNVKGTTAAYRYRSALQNRCLLFLLQDAVSGVVTGAEPRGRGVRLTVLLENVSAEATSVRELRYADGFALTAHLPVPFPASVDFGHPSTLTLQVDLTVRDCSAGNAFVSRYEGDDFAPPVTAVLLDGRTPFDVDLLVIGAPLLAESRAAVARSCP